MENTDKSESPETLNDPGALRYILGFVIIFGTVIAGIRYLTPDPNIEAQKELVNIYNAIEASHKANSANTDMLIRIFHYVRPHKHPVLGCKECFEMKEYYKSSGKDNEPLFND